MSVMTGPSPAGERIARVALDEVDAIRRQLRTRFRMLTAEDCDDAIQEAIRSMLAAASDLVERYPEAQLRQLLWQRAADRARNIVTAHQRRGELVDLGPDIECARGGPEAQAAEREELALAVAFVGALDERSRTWLRLHRIEGLKPREVRAATGWSEDQFAYAKKRAVAGLRELARKHGSGEWCDEHEPLFDPYLLGVSDSDDSSRVDRHIAHCLACRRELVRRRRGHLRVAGLAPPVLAGGGVLAKLGGIFGGLRWLGTIGRGGTDAGVLAGAGGGAVGGGTLFTAGALKAGLVAICVGGAAVACSSSGVLSPETRQPARPATTVSPSSAAKTNARSGHANGVVVVPRAEVVVPRPRVPHGAAHHTQASAHPRWPGANRAAAQREFGRHAAAPPREFSGHPAVAATAPSRPSVRPAAPAAQRHADKEFGIE